MMCLNTCAGVAVLAKAKRLKLYRIRAVLLPLLVLVVVLTFTGCRTAAVAERREATAVGFASVAQWRHLVESNPRITTLTVRQGVFDSAAISTLSALGHLDTLVLEDVRSTAQDWQQVEELASLRVLKVTAERLEGKFLVHIAKVSRLEVLELGALSELTVSDFAPLAAMKLKRIKVDSNAGLDSTVTEHIGKIVTLREIVIRGIEWRLGSAHNLSPLDLLASIDISHGGGLNPQELEMLLGIGVVRQLSLSGRKLQRGHVDALVARGQRLIELRACLCGLTDDLCVALLGIVGIQTLDVGLNSLSDMAIVGSIGPKMRKLYLYGNPKIGDIAVGWVVSDRRSVRGLDLAGCGVTNAGLRNLDLTHLEWISLAHCPGVTLDTVEWMRDQFSQLEVVYHE